MSENRYFHLIRQDCPVPAGTHVLAYCRDSGGEQQDRSVKQQAECIQEYCDHFGLVLEHLYIDDSRQASNTEKRDELQEMLFTIRDRFKAIHDRTKRARKAETNPFAIIFWKSSRLGRDGIESKFIKSDIRLRGLAIIDLTSKTTGDTGTDALLEAFEEWQDEKFLDDLSVQVRRGLAEIVSLSDTDPMFRSVNPNWPTHDGRYLSIFPGTPPTGFKSEPVQIGLRERKKRKKQNSVHTLQRIVPDHENDLWERCRTAWKMRHEKQSVETIHKATALFRTINGYSHFFENRIYTGDLEYGGVIFKDFVEALIPREWWEAEQQRRKERAGKRAGKQIPADQEPRRIASRHLLTGLVFCGAENGKEHPMYADTVPANEKRSQWDFYICTVKKNTRSRNCQAARVGAEALTEAVVDKLMSEVLTYENLRPIANDIVKLLAERNHDVSRRLTVAKGRLEKVRTAINKLMDALETTASFTSIQQRLQERESEERDLIVEISNLEALIVKPKDMPQVSDEQLRQFIDSMRLKLAGEDVELAKQTIRRFVAKVVVNEKAGTIFYTFPLQDLSRNGMMPPRGFGTRAVSSPEVAMSQFILALYVDTVAPQYPRPTNAKRTDRNQAIIEAYQNGETLERIAAIFDISIARAHQIIAHK